MARKFLLFFLVCHFFFVAVPALGWAAAIEVSAAQTRGFRDKVSRGMAEAAAFSAARLQALQLAEREIAALDDLRLLYGSDSISSRPRPEPVGLALAILQEKKEVSQVRGTPPDMQITASLTLELKLGADGRGSVAAFAARPLRLEFYAEAARKELEALKAYDRAAAFFLQGPVSAGGVEQRKLAEQELEQAFAALDATRGYIELLPEMLRIEDMARTGDIQARVGRNAVNAMADELLDLSAKFPAHYPLWTDLGYVQMLRENFAQADQALNQALKEKADFAPALNLRGLLFVFRELPALALADFNQAIALAPYQAEFYENRGMAYMLMESYVEMCSDVTRACTLGECGGLDWARNEGLCEQEK